MFIYRNFTIYICIHIDIVQRTLNIHFRKASRKSATGGELGRTGRHGNGGAICDMFLTFATKRSKN